MTRTINNNVMRDNEKFLQDPRQQIRTIMLLETPGDHVQQTLEN